MPSSTASRRCRSARGIVKLRSVRPSCETFCTIMSTWMPSAATALKIAAAMPGRSGTSSRVTFASAVFGNPRARLLTQGVPNVDPDAVASSVLHAPQLEDPRAGGGQLEHLLVGDVVDPAGLRVGPWV